MGGLVCGKWERKCHVKAVGHTGLTTGPPEEIGSHHYKVVGFDRSIESRFSQEAQLWPFWVLDVIEFCRCYLLVALPTIVSQRRSDQLFDIQAAICDIILSSSSSEDNMV
ncbi:unnamed protein product [Dovyalis caffra]|uniref:Uncharacterized protein n=1 Tax=Dovyalis caffra TaxID=77055 RepID=A0AAV1RYM9_9ROSI|nr:unnamed protein product [Dovyalis caffra]